MARTAIDDAKKIKIYTLYNQGIETAMLAERFGVSRRWINNILLKMKVKHGEN